MVWNLGSIVVDAAIALASAGAGAFLGAYFAYKKERRHRIEEEHIKQLSGARRSLLILGAQLNALMAYQKNVLDPVRDREPRWLFLGSFTTRAYKNLNQNLGDLDFLLGTNYGKLCFDVLLEEGRFQSAVDVINERARFHAETFQPIIHSAQEQNRPIDTEDDVERAVGHLVAGTLRNYTDQVFRHVDHTVESLSKVNEELLEALREHFPGEKLTFAKRPSDQV